MNGNRRTEYLIELVNELRRLPRETGWVEFKVNHCEPEEIGEYISALSNGAALAGQANGYVVWGIRDTDHEIVGTKFRPLTAKKGNEDLENWLVRLLNPRLHFRFFEAEVEEKLIAILEIPRAANRPAQFQGDEFIRIGSYRKKLKDHPEIERALWKVFETTPFERLMAAERLTGPQALALLDYSEYFNLLELPLPGDAGAILNRLAEDGLLAKAAGGRWSVTNLGAVLFAKNLNEFGSLGRKAPRLIMYKGKSRLETVREHALHLGYAAGFERLITLLNAILPRNEVMGQALRREIPMFPGPAVRELVANALIHQDLSVTGAGPMIEVFEDRMEITNPGQPLVEPVRFLDSPPHSRNEILAAMMRRFNICEERGTGVDKIVFQTEDFQLPAPLFEAPNRNTRAVLFGHKPFAAMDRDDKVRACYLHACLKHVSRETMTNSTLRERFGIEQHNSAIASRIIRDAIADGLIKPYDVEQGKKHARYVPFWA